MLERLQSLLSLIKQSTEVEWSLEQLAEHALGIAVDKMANAIKRVSIERGHDLSDYALCSFGGAGGNTRCRIADALGMSRIVIDPCSWSAVRLRNRLG